jgi:MFS family permease
MQSTKTTAARKTILALGWTSFFMDVSSEMIYPLLPVFLSSLGAGSLAIGFVAGLSESAASFFRVFSGALSDKLKKRKVAVLLGYGISTLSRPIVALASTWTQVLGFRLLDRAGKGVRTPPRDALIADAVSKDRYGRSYGIQRAMDTAGAVLGPALAAGILALGFGHRDVFWLSLIPACLAVATIQLFVREVVRKAMATRLPEAGRAKGASAGARMSTRLSLGVFPREMRLYLIVTAVFSLGNSSNFFLVLRAQQLGFIEKIIPILYLSINVVYALLSYPAGRLADRFGKARIVFVGYLVYAGVYALFAADVSKTALWLLFPLQGFYLAITDGVNTAYMATLIPQDRRATGFALYHTVIGLSLLPAGVLGGWLWRQFSPRATFIAGSILALAAGILFAVFHLRTRRTNGTGPSPEA